MTAIIMMQKLLRSTFLYVPRTFSLNVLLFYNKEDIGVVFWADLQIHLTLGQSRIKLSDNYVDLWSFIMFIIEFYNSGKCSCHQD